MSMNKEDIIKIIREANESQMYPEDMFDFSSYSHTPEEKREIMMKLNHLRLNVLSVVNIDEKDKVLLIGDDGDIVAEYLKSKASTVDFICDSEEIVESQSDEQIEIKKHAIGEKYTKIVSLGTFPEFGAGRYADVLKKLKKMLSDDGQLILAIPNQLGLKYFKGHREEYSKGYFIGIEGFKDYETRTFSRKKIKKLVKNAGFEDVEMYYPYPDYRYAMEVFSNEHLPKKGELADHFEGSEMQHLMLFDETAAWDEIIDAGLFKEFANSFLIIASKEAAKKKSKDEAGEHIVYARLSNDRSKDKSIRTIVTVDNDNNPHVYKASDSMMAAGHIKTIETSCGLLQKTYMVESTKDAKVDKKLPKVSLNCYTNANDKSHMITGGKNEVIELDFADGKSLEDILDKYLHENKTEEFIETVKTYAAVIRSATDKAKFEITPEFKRVFGEISEDVQSREAGDDLNEEVVEDVDLLDSLASAWDATSAADIDMIPANIIVSGDNWLILDYEWTFAFPVPLDYIIYRGMHYYMAGDAVGRKDIPENIWQILDIAEEEIEIFEKMEESFQRYVVEDHTPLSVTALQMVGKPSLDIDNMVRHTEAHVLRQYYSVIFDYGEGFDLKDERPIENAGIFADLNVSYEIKPDRCGRRAKSVKFNLWNYDSSIIEIKKLEVVLDDGAEIDVTDKIVTSAYKVDDGVYYFDHGSPCLYIMDIPENAKEFVAEIHMVETDETIKQALVPKILWKRGLKKAIFGKK